MKKESTAIGIIRSFGLVFGDIGTSPIYTITVVFLLLAPTPQNVMGVLSLVFWTISILVTAEYAWLATSLGKKGEGGTIVLREILIPLLKSGRKVSVVVFLSFIGVSLLVGDGVITPAISILSAVEGMRLIPGLEGTSREAVVAIAAVIAVILFAFQHKGTERVAGVFGPVMLVWFGSLTVSGLAALGESPEVAFAVNPYYAVRFLLDNGMAGFIVLSEVILCATGGEALYADMGHLGRKPIVQAWGFVFVALIINYFGQGAFLMGHPETRTVLFGMVYHQAPALYIPFLLLSVVATVIASQAMISGMFSIVYQAINTRIMPLFRIEYTSEDLRSQIYIPTVNWFLLLSVIFIMVEFGESSRLAAAYGLAVTGDMTLTGALMTTIFAIRKDYPKALAALLITFVDGAYLIANTYKIPHGGYWSLVIAAVPFAVILIYTKGQRKLYQSLKPMPFEMFLEWYRFGYEKQNKIKGTGLFFTRDTVVVPPYITRTMFTNGILYETNILISVIKREDPFGVAAYFRGEEFGPGLRVFEVQLGYMEVVDMDAIIREAGIDEMAIFYGIEDISSGNFIWKIFQFIKKNTPAFVQFYKLPPEKLHGVVTRIKI
jgi:KUP system potassium uptake protein